MPFQSRQPHVL